MPVDMPTSGRTLLSRMRRRMLIIPAGRKLRLPPAGKYRMPALAPSPQIPLPPENGAAGLFSSLYAGSVSMFSSPCPGPASMFSSLRAGSVSMFSPLCPGSAGLLSSLPQALPACFLRLGQALSVYFLRFAHLRPACFLRFRRPSQPVFFALRRPCRHVFPALRRPGRHIFFASAGPAGHLEAIAARRCQPFGHSMPRARAQNLRCRSPEDTRHAVFTRSPWQHAFIRHVPPQALAVRFTQLAMLPGG